MPHLRLATLHDTQQLLEIYAPYITDTAISFEYKIPSSADFRARIAKICTVYPYFVWEQAGILLGYAYANRQMERVAYQWNAELSIYLRPDAVGHGLGTSIYSALLELLRLQGYKTAYGCVALPNAASEALHQKLGFHSVGVWHQTGYKNKKWQNVGWFEKQLAPYEINPAPPVPITQLSEQTIHSIFRQYEIPDQTNV